jgi:hypothetical protein
MKSNDQNQVPLHKNDCFSVLMHKNEHSEHTKLGSPIEIGQRQTDPKRIKTILLAQKRS